MTKHQLISAREAYAAYFRGHVLVDVREPDMMARKKVADINHLVTLPMSELTQRFEELPPNRPIVLVSGLGNSGSTAAHFLLEHGFHDVAVVEGGMAEWEEEGLPTRN
ncbi:MAG: rhodanese-like domain-containing protein [Bacteroidetes bacterium]|nr:MAG: rhodanese-like domain-containing protein [Bacteroidota bacterium]